MATNKKKPDQNQSILSSADEGEGDFGGKTGAIEVRIQTGVSGLQRDDLLAPNEIKRLQLVHEDKHKSNVDKQKTTREQRAAVKDGRYVSSMEGQHRQGLGGGSGGGTTSRFKKHPISDKFSGMRDKQVVGIPSLNEAETNSDLKDQLENKLENRLQNVPRFNPRPRPS